MSNISVLPDPADIGKYSGAVKPFWLEQMAARVRAMGQTARLPALLDASRRLQASLLKLNIEGARLSPDIDGHHQWLFRDYWTQSTGFVNQFDEARAITPAYARRFIGPVVLLWARDRAAFQSGDVMPLRLFLSDFRPRSAATIRTIRVACAGRSVVLRAPANAGGRGLLGPWTGALRLPALPAPGRLTVAASAGAVRNGWPVWVFPAPVGSAPSREAPIVARWLTSRMLDRLEAGARVLLMDGSSFPSLPARFKPAWWHGDDAGDHCYGNLFASHPALRGYPGQYGDIEAAGMLDNRPVVLLDEIPGQVEPIVQCIDVPWRMRRKAYLFEARVGKGRLLVCTLNLSPGQRRRDPAAAWLYDRLLRYATSSEFRPAAAIPADWLRKRVGDIAVPDVDTWIEGFSRIVASSEPPRKWYSYREDNVPTYPVRQTDGKQRLMWLTAPVPRTWPHPTVTFAWAGGIGWETEPAGGRFSLHINGRHALDFPFTVTSAAWRSTDGTTTLRYLVRRTVGPDSFGLFLLTIPASSIRPGQPVELTVTATASSSKRWFSLVPYRDVVATERED